MENWHNLVENLKTVLLVDGAEPLVEDPAVYNAIVADLTWYNLKGKLQQLVDLINYDGDNLDVTVEWYTMPEDIEAIKNYFI